MSEQKDLVSQLVLFLHLRRYEPGERWIAEDPNSCASCKTIQKPFNEADLAWVKESGHQLESVTLKLELHGRQRA